MKRIITLTSLTLISTNYLLIFAHLLGANNYVYAFFPDSPQQLTLFDKNGHVYNSECPNLDQVKDSSAISKKLALPFTLLNWNIYKQQNTTWQVKLQEWSERADIITLQEAKHTQQLIDFSHLRNLNYYQNHAFNLNGYVYGVNTLSTSQVSHLCGTRYFEPWIQVPKTGLATIYPIDKHQQSLLVINLHGVNFTLTSTPLKEQLAPYFALIEQHQGSVIFSGDFNTWSDARLQYVENTLSIYGFEEAVFRHDQRSKVFGLPLDHVFFRGLKVISAESLATDASDHSPQLVTFDIE
ncbi:MAG: endonuclease/exonuclease/phosphatase family protein [Psychromonas sp.]